MKKIVVLLSLFLFFIPKFFTVEAIENQINLEPFESLEVYDDLYDGPINEVSAFANIVIFIKFADETAYTPPHTFLEYDVLFNDELNASLKNYYLEVSYGQLTIDSYLVSDGTTYIFYQDVNNRNYYEPYDNTFNPEGYTENERAIKEHELLENAINFVDENNYIGDEINLDSNDDGFIDSITFMVSGEDSGWSSLFWPHMWALYTSQNSTINGVEAYDYTFELLGNTKSYDYKANVGVLAHETFHLISAPDLYHYYGYDYINSVGPWGIMDNTGEIPSHMLGYMKEQYGNWISNVQEITSTGTYTLEPLRTSGDNLYKIDLGYSNEYVYIEYRDNEGFYESNLPDAGLIVYRVDKDYIDDGNVYGYYDYFGDPADEVFIFRPGISFDTLPIIFPDFDDEYTDEDGQIEHAALSQNNLYDEMGTDTEIPMFYSDGTLMDIKITNVVEYDDGYISFTVDFNELPQIELVSDIAIPEGTELFLYDGIEFEYRAEIVDIAENVLVYYTTDGTIPDDTSMLYEGEIINFDASSNIINIAVYINGVFSMQLSREFDFVIEITTDHSEYGNNQNITWYLDLQDESNAYNLNFASESYFEDGFDFLYIISNTETLSYTGAELSNLTLSYSEDIIIQLDTDFLEDDFYGFSVEVYVYQPADIYLNGLATIYLEAGEEYVELGAYIVNGLATDTIEILGTVTDTLVGTYILSYIVIDENLVIKNTITREVIIVDTTSPTLTLNGDELIYIEVYFGEFIDESVTPTDNSTGELDIVVTGEVDYNTIGTYIISYQVFDSEGNASIIIQRSVIVEDTTAPSVTLNASIDTIYIGEDYLHTSIVATDNYSSNPNIVINDSVDTSAVGVYIIEYIVTDESLNETITTRYVNVIAREVNYELTIGKTINTIKIGEEFNEADCYVENSSNDIVCDVDLSNVDINTAGTYEVIYSAMIDNVIYSRSSYVFVYEETNDIIWHYDKSRRDYL